MPERNKFRSEFFLKTEIGYWLIWSCGLAKSNCPLLDEQTFKPSLCSMRFRIIIFFSAMHRLSHCEASYHQPHHHQYVLRSHATHPPPPKKKKIKYVYKKSDYQ